MKNKLIVAGAAALVATLVITFSIDKQEPLTPVVKKEKKRKSGAPAGYFEARALYDLETLKDPATGKIPRGIFELEAQFARTLPVKSAGGNQGGTGVEQTNVNNGYIPAGPFNIGGRTRAVAYDVRYNGGSNRVVIAGCVSGGLMRSTDGGINWTLVSPQNDIHNLTALAQDPRPGFQDIWYAGGGEFQGNTASQIGAPYLGYGIWKSTDNGITWNKLTLNVTDLNGAVLGAGQLEIFDHPFDIVHRIVVNPVNGHLYVAGHRRLVRSTNAGTSFQVVFAGSAAANSETGQMDIYISNAGRVFLSVNGGYPEAATRGLWISSTGDQGSYVRIAGGQNPGVDSVTGWRGNSTNGRGRRILVTLAPSNNDIGYVFYENGLSSDPPILQPEADLFRFEISGSSINWSNRSQNMPDFPGGNLSGSDPLTVQGGYDMMVRVKPNDPNTVFIGGTNLYRSTDGFTTSSNTAWIGGYATNFTYGLYPESHPDIHEVAFNPADPNEMICANDGGVQKTLNVNATPVSWIMAKYQTLQYYFVAMDPGAGRNNFAGGSQDNGVRLRDRLGILGTPPADSNNHRLIFSADGTSVGFSRYDMTTQQQFLYGGYQLGNIFRYRMLPSTNLTNIRPNNLTTNPFYSTGFGEFVTNFRLNHDNTEDLFYVNFNRLFRTITASSVTAGGWEELTGVSNAIGLGIPTNPNSIRAIAFTRGPYHSQHALYIGTTNGKILRIDDSRNAAAAAAPADITPPQLIGNVQDIAVNPNNDDEVIAVVSNYGISLGSSLQNIVNIWWTNNAKSAAPTWRQAEGNLGGTLTSGFISGRSCIIATKLDASNNPVTEYYVGTGAGLFSTVNLGQTLTSGASPTWVREGAGTLNLAVIASMVYRPADNVLVVGTHGNGMYFTYLGTPNWVPTQFNSVQPVTNDRNFIKNVFPTVSRNQVYFQTGNMLAVKKLFIEVTDMNGKIIHRRETPYSNGNIDLSGFASGPYILTLYSHDGRFRHVQKLFKQ
ncbi:MAG: T9SS type A sorting domain-containing protein [Flavisolibacter sp.]|jgi:hypothetical protein|nr:T9SS type A sorting domain-containing protein [Flavisolibacter sp.]